MAVLIGIDVGTTNWKAAATDTEGHLLALRSAPATTEQNAGGEAYYDADYLWRTVTQLVRGVVEDLQAEDRRFRSNPATLGATAGSLQGGLSAAGIAAVAVTGMGEAIVPIDRHGAPAGHIVPWFDVRSVEQADRIRRELTAARVFEITGLECNPIFTLAKIMWIRENQPETFERAEMWLSVVDYVNYMLSGLAMTDYTEASRTLMLDLRGNEWSEEMLALAGISRNSLPPIGTSATLLGPVTPAAAEATGLPAETKIVLGGHDHLCGSLAAGVLLGRRVLDSSGTAESIVGFSELCQDLPRAFQGLRLGRYLDPQRFVTWGGIIASGRSVDWAIDTFASQERWGLSGSRIPYEQVNQVVAATPVGSRGLLYLPHLRGCGAPHWNPRARGALIGLRDHHTPAECMRAVFEGLCYEARIILDVTDEVFGFHVDTLCTTGGGAKSPVWQQIKADVTGRNVEIPEVEEATLMGAALLAGIGIGVFADLTDASRRTYRAKSLFTPNPDLKATYDRLFGTYRRLYDALVSINMELTEAEGRLQDEETGV